MANTFSSCLKNENVSNTYYQNFVSTLTPSLIYDYLPKLPNPATSISAGMAATNGWKTLVIQ